MKITLLHYTPLNICSHAIRTCYQSFAKGDNGGEIDMGLIDRISNKYKHSSTLEHLYFNFYIQGISRACLQELSRHRIASLSVKSTRYTLGELKKEDPFGIDDTQRARKYCLLTENKQVNMAIISALENLRQILLENISNDIAKYALPEAYLTELTWSINARSLQNFLSLRSDKRALKEIRDLAYNLYNALPSAYKFLFEGFLANNNKEISK